MSTEYPNFSVIGTLSRLKDKFTSEDWKTEKANGIKATDREYCEEPHRFRMINPEQVDIKATMPILAMFKDLCQMLWANELTAELSLNVAGADRNTPSPQALTLRNQGSAGCGTFSPKNSFFLNNTADRDIGPPFFNFDK